MPYAFETEDRDYSDFAGGRVIYSLPGAPAFPARLASEIFLRGQKLTAKSSPLRLFDPCCGGAYHLAAIGFLHGAAVEHILAADIDRRALDLAEKNLGLLTGAGLLVPQADAGWLAPGQRVEVLLPPEGPAPRIRVQGTIVRISPHADPARAVFQVGVDFTDAMLEAYRSGIPDLRGKALDFNPWGNGTTG